MLGKKVGIDLGTTTTRIIVKGEGMIAHRADGGRDPRRRHADGGVRRRRVRGLGGGSRVPAAPAASPAARSSTWPSARWLVNHAMIRAAGRQRIFKPDVVIAVMSSLPGGQRRSLLEAAALAGARTVYLLDAPARRGDGRGRPPQRPERAPGHRHRRRQDRHRRARARGHGERPLPHRPRRRAPPRLRRRPRPPGARGRPSMRRPSRR